MIGRGRLAQWKNVPFAINFYLPPRVRIMPYAKSFSRAIFLVLSFRFAMYFAQMLDIEASKNVGMNPATSILEFERVAVVDHPTSV